MRDYYRDELRGDYVPIYQPPDVEPYDDDLDGARGIGYGVAIMLGASFLLGFILGWWL
jgi:hypothetical protein